MSCSVATKSLCSVRSDARSPDRSFLFVRRKHFSSQVPRCHGDWLKTLMAVLYFLLRSFMSAVLPWPVYRKTKKATLNRKATSFHG